MEDKQKSNFSDTHSRQTMPIPLMTNHLVFHANKNQTCPTLRCTPENRIEERSRKVAKNIYSMKKLKSIVRRRPLPFLSLLKIIWSFR